MGIISKNLKVIYRSKLSFLLVILAPILIVFLVGTAFNSTNLTDIQVSVYSSSYSELTNDLIANLDNNQFLTEQVDSEELCQSLVKQGISSACVIFPPELSIEGNKDSVMIYVDNSRMNLAYTLINQINEQISSKGSELGIAMATDLLNVLESARNSLPNQNSKIYSALNDLKSIESSSNSVNSFSDSVKDLDNALKLLDSVETESDLSGIKSGINSVKTKLLDADLSMGSISEKSQSGKENINTAYENLNQLISELNKMSVDDAENIVMPIKTEVAPLTNESSNWSHLFPTLIALIILLSGIVLSSSIVLTERRGRANFRNFMTPTSNLSFVLGAYFTSMIILLFQMIILFAGTIYFTKFNLIPVIGLVSLVLFLSSTVFVFLGMLIGYLFKSDETTTLASISIASLLIFFSNTILPTESIKGYLRTIVVYNPLLVSDSLLKKVILFKESFNLLIPELIILLVIIAVLLCLNLIARKMTRRLI